MTSTADTTLVTQAVSAALAGDWNTALSINQQLLTVNPGDLEALNRIARAYSELGDFPKARETYSQVLELDKYNSIATKNLKKLKLLSEKKVKNSSLSSPTNNHSAQPSSFLEEPGKTKVVQLVNPAEPTVLSGISEGDSVLLAPRGRRITITTSEGLYLGCLPDDLSRFMQILIKGGNKYEAFARMVKPTSLSVFIRELHRSKRFGNRPSFLGNIASQYYSYVRDEILRAPGKGSNARDKSGELGDDLDERDRLGDGLLEDSETTEERRSDDEN